MALAPRLWHRQRRLGSSALWRLRLAYGIDSSPMALTARLWHRQLTYGIEQWRLGNSALWRLRLTYGIDSGGWVIRHYGACASPMA